MYIKERSQINKKKLRKSFCNNLEYEISIDIKLTLIIVY